MADNALKFVQPELIDTWSRGPNMFQLLNILGFVAKGGDSIDIPEDNANTVNTSETGSVASTALASPNTLTINRPKFINRQITRAQAEQLLGGSGNYRRQLLRSCAGDLKNAIDRDLIEHGISQAGSTLDATHHHNVAGDALVDTDVNACEADMLSQDGVSYDDLVWIASPKAIGNMKSVAEYVPSMPNLAQPGMGTPERLNGISILRHNGMPGLANRYEVATTAVSVSSNVATATVAAGHGIVPGQLIYTTGLSVNVAVGSPVQVSSVTATTVVYPLTTCDGAMADGIGTIHSASAYAALIDTRRFWVGADSMVPETYLVKREGNAGHALQLFQHIGRLSRVGSVKFLHSPD